jgi:hypothetical protein
LFFKRAIRLQAGKKRYGIRSKKTLFAGSRGLKQETGFIGSEALKQKAVYVNNEARKQKTLFTDNVYKESKSYFLKGKPEFTGVYRRL